LRFFLIKYNKMNKTLFITGMAFFLASGLYAQEAKRVTYANKKQIEDFFNSKTMVVLDADQLSGYNIVATDAVKKYWTITPFEIITSAQFDQMRTDPKLSFIFLSKVQLVKEKQEVYYQYLNVCMGAKVKDLIDLPQLLMLPLAYTGVDEDDYVDKLPLMFRFAQVHLNNLKTAQNPQTWYILKNYGNQSKQLMDKTLLVKESDLSEEVNTLEKIRKIYPGTVKIVSSEDIIQAIEEQAPNTAILHQLGPAENENKGRSYCLIFGTDDANLYYYNHQNITQRRPEGMLVRDFKLIMGK